MLMLGRSRSFVFVLLMALGAAALSALAMGGTEHVELAVGGAAPVAPSVARSGGLSRLVGGGHLLSSASSRFSSTYRLADGTMRTRVASVPVNFRDGQGRWRPIDATLTARAGVFVNRAGGHRVELPQRLSRGAQVSSGGNRLSMRLLGADGAAAVRGAQARYPDVLPGVSAVYDSQTQGLREQLVLSDSRAPTRFVFTLNASRGLRARQSSGGAVVFSRGGRQVFVLPASYAFAQGDEGETHAVGSVLRRSGRGWTLTVSANHGWVQRALRRGPVVVDPTVIVDPDSQDCTMESDHPTTRYCSSNSLIVGYDARSPAHDHRALVQFDVSTLPRDSVVLNATLELYLGGHSTSNLKQVGAYRVLRPWTNKITWNRYDATNSWTSPGAANAADASTTAESVRTIGDAINDWVDWYPTKLVQGWVDGSIDNHGMLIRDVTPNTTDNELGFASRENSSGPNMEIEWAPRAGVLDTYGFDSQDVSDGSALRVNVGNGNLLLQSVDAPNLQVSTGTDAEETASWHVNTAVLAGSRVFNSSQLEHGQFGFGGVLGSGTDVQIARQLDGSWSLRGPSGFTVLLTAGTDGRFHGPPEMPATLEILADGTKTLTLPNGDTLTFDQRAGEYAAYLAAWKNRSAGSASYVRDDTTNLSATDPGAYLTTFDTDPDPDKGITELITTDGAHQYSYDSEGKLLTAAPAGGSATQYDYDYDGRLASVEPPAGSSWTIAYDSAGRAHEITEHPTSGAVNTTTYDYAAGSTTAHYPGGTSMEFHVNPATARLDEVIFGASPPTVSIGGPLASAGTLTSPNSYGLDVDLADAQGVSQLVIRIDGEPELVQANPCGASSSCHLANALVLDAGQYAGGLHPVEVTATDPSGAQRVRRLIVTVAPDTHAIVDDPPTDPTAESEIQRAMRFRGEVGLQADEAHVRAVQADPANEPGMPANSVRLEPGELSAMRLRTAVEQASDAIDEYGGQHADEFAELYVDPQAIVHVGFTANQAQHLAAIRALFAFPDRVQVFTAQRNRAQLQALIDRIEADDAALLADGIDVTVANEAVQTNDVEVGVPAPSAAIQQTLTQRYGAGVRVVQEDPAEATAGARTLFQRPLVGGLRIGSPAATCSSGFGAAGDPKTFDYFYRGVPIGVNGPLRALIFSAGHCAKDRDSDSWSQGGKIFGSTRAWNFTSGSAADAMVISTKASNVSPWVYLYKDYTSKVIVRKIGSVRDLRNDDVGEKVCFSGATTGTPNQCGLVSRVRSTLKVNSFKGRYFSGRNDSYRFLADRVTVDHRCIATTTKNAQRPSELSLRVIASTVTTRISSTPSTSCATSTMSTTSEC